MKILQLEAPNLQDPRIRRLLQWSLAAHLVAAFFSLGYHHYDEHYQILEFALLKLGGTSAKQLPWEYTQKMRPWLQPFVAYLIAKVASFVGITSPFLWTFFLRLISGLLGWASTVLLIRLSRTWFKSPEFYLAASFVLSLFWFFPYLHVRPSSESWATSFFILGLCSLFYSPRSPRLLFLSGLFWGLAFDSRYVILLMIVSAALWLAVFEKRYRSFLFCFFGFFVAVLIGILLDRWGYGDWSSAPWNYFRSNLIEDNLSHFGVTPWWMYFRYLSFDATLPFGLALIAGTIAGWILFPRHLVTWVSLPFVLFHFCLGHKETRFLFPVASFSVLLLMMSLERFRQAWMFSPWLIRSLAIVNLLFLLVACVKPASSEVALYHFIYRINPEGPERFEYYSYDDDPYLAYGLEAVFYEPKILKRHQVRDILEIASSAGKNQKVFIVSRKFYLPPEGQSVLTDCKALYRSLPSLVTAFNIGHWIERTSLWSVFECRTK